MFWRLGWRHIKLRKLQYSLIALAIMTPVATAGAIAFGLSQTLDSPAMKEPQRSSSPTPTNTSETTAATNDNWLLYLLDATPWVLAFVLLSVMAALCGGAGFRVVSAERLRETEELSRVGASPKQLRKALAAPGAIVTTIAAFLPVVVLIPFFMTMKYPWTILGLLPIALCAWIAGLIEVWKATKNHDSPGAKPAMLGTAAADRGKRRAVVGLVVACLGALYLAGWSLVWAAIAKVARLFGKDLTAENVQGSLKGLLYGSTEIVAIAVALLGFGIMATIPWLLRRGEALPSKLPVTLRLGLRDVSRSGSVFTPITQVVFVSCLTISTIAVVSSTDTAEFLSQDPTYSDGGAQTMIELVLLGLSLAIFVTIASVSTGFVRLAQRSRQETYHAVGSQPVQRRKIAVIHAATPYVIGTCAAFVACAFGIPALSFSLMNDPQNTVPLQIPWLTVLVPPILTIGVVAAIAWFSTPADVSPRRRIT